MRRQRTAGPNPRTSRAGRGLATICVIALLAPGLTACGGGNGAKNATRATVAGGGILCTWFGICSADRGTGTTLP